MSEQALTVMQNAAPAADPMLALVERAARDQTIDVEKMERLLALAERLQVRKAEAEYDAAMNAAQAQMRPVANDSDNPQTRSRYASYGALDRAVRPIYTEHGFSLSFGTRSPMPDRVTVTCRVSHRAGHTERVEIDMPADGKGAKGGDVQTKTHATGSAVSYGMRYLLKMIWNIAVGEYDDDGNAAGKARGWQAPGAGTPKPHNVAPPPIKTPPSSNAVPARATPTPDAKALMAAKAALEAHLVKCKAKLISDLAPNRDAALDYCRAAKIVLSTEDLEDGQVRHWFPSVDWTRSIQENEAAIVADRDRHLDGIEAMMRGDKIPDAPAVGKTTQPAPEPEEPAPTISEKPDLHGCEDVFGTVESVNVKNGTGKGGPWVRSAVCLDKTWYSTFHQNIGARAVGLKGEFVHVWFKARAAGNDMVWIEKHDDPEEAPQPHNDDDVPF